MIPDLFEQLQECLEGRVCLIGVGNVDGGDDAFGVRLAKELLKKFEVRSSKFEVPNEGEAPGFSDFAVRTSDVGPQRSVLIAGTTPERFIGRIVEAGFDHVIFVDAVECGGAPGSVVFLNSQEMASRFPQVSTHKLSLGMLAKFIEADGGAWAWLLGVQPELLRPGGGLTPPVRRTLEMLAELLSEMLAGDSVRSATGHRPSAIAGSGAVWPTSGWGERPREPETEGVARPAARRESRPTELHHNPLV